MTATATCTCRVCGKAFTKELYESGKGASRRLAEKVEWAENGGIDLCPDCWKEEKRAQEKAAGLTCDIRPGNVFGDDVKVFAVFGGDSYTYKDSLKSAGARWTEDYPEKKVLQDILGLSRPRKAWVITAPLGEVDALIEKVKEIGATVSLPSENDLALWAAWRQETLKERKEAADKKAAEKAEKEAKTAAALEKLGPIPAWPACITAKRPEGSRWNGKFYGRKGSYNVYFSGEKVNLTDEEKDAMEKAYTARQEWTKRKKEIEGGN